MLDRLLAQRPDELRWLSNLLLVLRDQGRSAQADALAQRLARIEPDPPYAFFERGRAALAAGNLTGARDLFAKEVARAPYNHEFQAWLGATYARLGDAKRAATHLNAAIEASTSHGTRELYSTKLARLKAVPAR